MSFNEAYLASARDPGDITTSIDKQDTENGQHLCGTAKDLAARLSRQCGGGFQ